MPASKAFLHMPAPLLRFPGAAASSSPKSPTKPGIVGTAANMAAKHGPWRRRRGPGER